MQTPTPCIHRGRGIQSYPLGPLTSGVNNREGEQRALPLISPHVTQESVNRDSNLKRKAIITARYSIQAKNVTGSFTARIIFKFTDVVTDVVTPLAS